MNQIFAFSIILLLLGMCGPTNEIAENATNGQQANNTTNPANNMTTPPNPFANITPPKNDSDVWQMINKDTVDAACLEAAKAEAGQAAWVIKGCNCSESATADRKTYDCIIPAGPLNYAARLDCNRTERICSIESELGSDNISFDDIISFYQQ